jgi:hypothetical protein
MCGTAKLEKPASSSRKAGFFGVWTGAEAGDKSLEFSRAPRVFGLSARPAGRRVQI